METEPIAVVGVGCTLPGGVHTLDEVRAVFEEGRDCIGEIPGDRWAVDDLYHPDSLEPGRTYVRHGGFVDDIDRFDAAFFGISDEEAVHMDPQQRMLLQTVWHSLENAGLNPDTLTGTATGVFLALMAYDYGTLKGRGGLAAISAYEAMDTDSISAGRIAHFLGLQGPCLTVDTACSGSLVALHLARQSILSGECDTAIVGGANAILAPNVHISFSKLGLFSRAGQCRTFDADADGYVRSEGCVAAVLKRQSLAEEQGDPILATIVGSAVNHTGRTRTLTAPDGDSQQRVIRSTLAAAGVDPSQVGYVEAHGTGTPVGDPIEMDAIVKTYGAAPRPNAQPLYVSSGKSNVGHIEAGAGLLGVVRAALSLHKETIYPSLHLNRLNPKIDLSGAAVEIPAQPVDWPRGDTPRMAAVNSFGYSGTNAHALLREAPLPRPAATPDAGPDAGSEAARDNGRDAASATATPRSEELLVLSAKSPESLRELAGRWADFLSRTRQQGLPEAVFTAAAGRAVLRHRLAVTGATGTQIANGLRQWQTGRACAAVSHGRPRGNVKAAFVFSGQGTQYAGMARELYAQEPAFAAAIDRCAQVMDDALGVPLRQVLFDEDSGQDIHDTRLAQPALFAVGYALAQLLCSWGVEPAAVTGHSIGEVTAACVGGMLSLEDAAQFAVQRGRLMGELPREGRMLAVTADEETVRGWLSGREDRAAVAAVNGTTGVVVSGAADAVDEIAALAEAARVDTAWLRTSHAFHSPLMEPALPELHKYAAELRPGRPAVPVVSTLTGKALTGEEGPEHWTAQARQTVRFHDAVREVVASDCPVVVEVGAHPALIRQIREAFADAGVTAVPTLDRDRRDVRNLLTAAGALFTSGVGVDLPGVYRGAAYRRISTAPQYPFRKDRYWWGDDQGSTAVPDQAVHRSTGSGTGAGTGSGTDTVPGPAAAPRPAGTARHPSGRHASAPAAPASPAAVPAPRPESTVHDRRLTAAAPWSDHRVHGATVYPATGYLDLAVQAHAETGGGHGPVALNDIEFTRPLVLTHGRNTTARLTLGTADPSGDRAFTISGTVDTVDTADADSGTTGPNGSAGGAGWAEHCHGTIGPLAAADRAGRLPEALRADMPTALTVPQLYGKLRDGGIDHGFHFATVRELWLAAPGREEALARITAVPDGAPAESHPFRVATVLDGCLQLAAALMLAPGADLLSGGYVPVAVRRLTLSGPLPDEVWAHVRRRPHDSRTAFVIDVRVTDGAGLITAELEGVEFRHAGAMAGSPVPEPEEGGAERLSGRSRRELLDLLTPLGAEERRQAVIQWLGEEVRETIGKSSAEMELADGIDPSLALLEIGLDSLRVTALQRRIQEKLEFRYKAMEALDYQTIEGLADFLLDRVLTLDQADGPAGRTDRRTAAVPADRVSTATSA